jgi:hypothetical protein
VCHTMELQITEMIPTQIQTTPIPVPKKIFIVPYRDRIQHKFFFSNYMTFLLEDDDDYEIYFSHQADSRPFNRGATKNIGFLAMKNKYPDDYLDIDFIFNDVDTMPFNKIMDYSTTHGIVKHLYGFNFALGGIVIFKGADFEAINGYPNFWGWGMEDNVVQNRCHLAGLQIDRSQFYPLGDQNILQLFEGIKRVITHDSHARAKQDNGVNGLSTIFGLRYDISEVSRNPADNINVVLNPNINVININSFSCLTNPSDHDFEVYDLRDKRVSTKPVQMNLMSPNSSKVQTERTVKRTLPNPANKRFGMFM